MKKLLLSCALAFAALIANGQTLSTLWYHEANGDMIDPAASNNSAMAYHDGRLYVAKRGGEVYVVNPNDYNTTTNTLNASAYATTLTRPASFNESIRFSKIKVTTDGVIYATAVQTNSIIVIYRWASYLDTNPLKFSITDPSIVGRVGDFLAYMEQETTLICILQEEFQTAAPASTGQNLYVLKVTAGVPALYKTIDMDLAKYTPGPIYDVAKGSISPVSESVLWIKSSQLGVHYKRIELDFVNSVVSKVKNYTAPSANYTVGEIMNEGGRGFLFAGTSSTNSAGLGFKLSVNTFPSFTAEPTTLTETTSAIMPKASFTTSTFGYGEIAYAKNLDGTTTIFLLVSKNGLVAFKSSAPLPVSLTSFDAALVKGQSTLTWETASENNNKGFEVLRSTDGKDFTKIDFVNAKGQNGNSSTALNYTYVDCTAKPGTNYYQLKQVDLDGKTELFKEVKSVNVSLANGVVVFPNPATTYVSVNAGTTDYKGVKYELFDGNGKKVLSEKARAEQQDISLTKLTPAIYYLKISKNNVVQSTVKLIKQ